MSMLHQLVSITVRRVVGGLGGYPTITNYSVLQQKFYSRHDKLAGGYEISIFLKFPCNVLFPLSPSSPLPDFTMMSMASVL